MGQLFIDTRAALLLSVLALATVAPAHAAERKVPRNFYGAMFAGDVERAPLDARERAWDKLTVGGVESVRVVFNWSVAQPERDGYISWAVTDAHVAAATAHRISVLPVVIGAPGWARKYPSQNESPPTPASAYAAFMGQLVNRYGPRGTFWDEHPELPRRPLRDWQIWNEPELRDHWYREGDWSASDAKEYGALLRASYKAIHAADPGARVVLAGLTNFAWETLAYLHRHAGIRSHFDVAAVHAFPGKWQNVAVILRRFRRALDKGGSRRVPIWLTEIAWPAAKGRTTVPDWANTPYYRQFITTDKGAASRLSKAYAVLSGRRFREQTRLQRTYWFTAASAFAANNLWDYAGLLQFDGSKIVPKPAYAAFRARARRDQGCAKDTAGRCRR